MRQGAFTKEDAFYYKHQDTYDPYAGGSYTFKRFYEENYLQLIEQLKMLGLNRTSRILTVGVGPGNPDLEMGLRETQHIVGVDVSQRALGLCQRRFPEALLTLASAHALPFPEGFFDFVLFVLVVHHLTGQHIDGLERSLIHYALDETRRVLSCGGTVLCLEPNLLFPSTFAIYPINYVMQKLRPGWRGLVPTERNISPFQLRALFGQHGFTKFRYRATTFANSKLPKPVFDWILEKEIKLRQNQILRNFGVFTLAWAQK
jgi:ubiquinone/menaquinone biosynthesis C-methylase UbiE